MENEIAQHIDQIREDIDNPAPYLVFADWLQEHENPWGELIILEHSLEQRKGDSAIAAQIDKLCKKYGWIVKEPKYLLRVVWKWGFIRSIHVYDPHSRRQKAKLESIVTPALQLPMAALIEKYTVFHIKENYTGALPERAISVGLTSSPDDKMPSDRSAAWVWTKEIPKTIGEYQNLRFLDFASQGEIPDEIGEIPLEMFEFGTRDSLPDAVWGIETLGILGGILNQSNHWSQVHFLLAGFLRARTPRAQRIVEARLFLEKNPQASRAQLLMAIDSNLAVVRTGAHAHLSSMIPSPLGEHPIIKGSVVACLGSLNLDKGVLRKRLADIGAKLTTKVGAKTTHALVGLRPNGKQYQVGQLPMLVEEHLGPIMEVDCPSLNNRQLSALLRSKDDASICKAVLSLQEQAAVPAELLPELFCILQDTSLSHKGKGRQLARKLFALYAPLVVRKAVSTHMKTSVLLAGESKVATRLTSLGKSAGDALDMVAVARIFNEDHNTGVKFVLGRDDPGERDRILRTHIRGHKLSLVNRGLTQLPPLDQYELVDIDLTDNRFAKVSAALGTLTSLETLNLSDNYLTTVSDTLSGLSNLKQLDLSRNRHLLSIDDSVWGIESLTSVLLSGCVELPLNKRLVKSLLAGFAKSKTPRVQRIFEAALFQQRYPVFDRGQCLQALDSNVEPVRTAALSFLAQHVPSPLGSSPLDGTSEMVLLGSFENREALVARIKSTGARVGSQIGQSTTHVLVGAQANAAKIQFSQVALVLEVHL